MQIAGDTPNRNNAIALWWLGGAVMFVLAGFELGIMLQGQQQPDLSEREVALMFAECRLVMLGINALLFFTPLLKNTPARSLMGAGLILAMVGLAVLARASICRVDVRGRQSDRRWHRLGAARHLLLGCRRINTETWRHDGRPGSGGQLRPDIGVIRGWMAFRCRRAA